MNRTRYPAADSPVRKIQNKLHEGGGYILSAFRDPKLLAAQARAQTDQAIAAHKMQIEQQQARNAAIHLQVKAQTEAELAKLKADLDAKLQILDAHIKAATVPRFSSMQGA